jgi:AraC family transcriptional regulator
MAQQRVTGIMDGRPTPIGEAPPPFSSAGTRWAGFLLEGHRVDASRDEIGWAWHSTHVGVCTGGESELTIEGGAGSFRYASRVGGITIFPAGTDYTSIHHGGGGLEFIVVELDSPTLGRLMHGEDAGRSVQMTPQVNILDQQITNLLHGMRLEIENGCPTGALYAESLSIALASYVSSRYAIRQPEAGPRRPRLSPAQRSRVIDYIHLHIGSDFSLVDLADVVNLSPRHFSRLFRNTVGNSPHRYVADLRVKMAREMLSLRQESIAEVAANLGFADQSHFTAVFRKSTGISPKRFQRQL